MSSCSFLETLFRYPLLWKAFLASPSGSHLLILGYDVSVSCANLSFLGVTVYTLLLSRGHCVHTSPLSRSLCTHFSSLEVTVYTLLPRGHCVHNSPLLWSLCTHLSFLKVTLYTLLSRGHCSAVAYLPITLFRL